MINEKYCSRLMWWDQTRKNVQPWWWLVLALLLAQETTHAQAPAWQMAIAAGQSANNSSSSSNVTATATNAAGDVYVAGYFSGTFNVAGTTLNTPGFVASSSDIFVAKWSNSANRFVWVVRSSGLSYDKALGLAVSGNSVYVTGTFLGSSIEFDNNVLTNGSYPAGTEDIFVTKIADMGTSASFVWAQRAGGTKNDIVAGIAVNGPNVYVAGYFVSPTVSFGNTTLSTVTLPRAFIAKLTDAGATARFDWGLQGSGANNGGYINAIAANGPNVYAVGKFSGQTTTLGGLVLTNSDPTGNTSEIFVVKVADGGAAGSYVWAQSAGGPGHDEATGVASSGTALYVVGNMYGASATFGNTVLVNAGPSNTSDAYVSKLTDAGSSGSFVWAQRAGGTGQDQAAAVAVAGSSVYLTGRFGGTTAAFGSTTLTNNGTASFASDVFVAKVADAGASGAFAWAQRGGGPSEDQGNAISISGSAIYVAGYVIPPAGFGTATVSSGTTSLNGFLASVTDNVLTNTATGHSSPAARIKLFPNPATGVVHIELTGIAATAATQLALTNSLGQVVQSWPVNGLRTPGMLEVSTAALAPGLYLLTIDAGNTREVGRLIVE